MFLVNRFDHDNRMHERCPGFLDSDSEQFICPTTTKNPYICNQNIKIPYNICCADQETCIKINVDRYHAGHQQTQISFE